MGPAGSGKSTLVSTLLHHAQVSNRSGMHAINLDPAAEHFDYEPILDVRDFIQLEDTMEDPDLKFGPNGGLVFCLEYLMENREWLEENLGNDGDTDEYLLLDCPGQIELYTHMNVFKQLAELLTGWNFRVGGLFLLDSHFMVDGAKFLSGSMAALSVMVNLEIPHINVLSKIDLLSAASKKRLDGYLDPDTRELSAVDVDEPDDSFGTKYRQLSMALGRVLDDYSLVKYFPLDITDEESIGDLMLMIDTSLQYGEDEEVKTHDFEYPDREDDEINE